VQEAGTREARSASRELVAKRGGELVAYCVLSAECTSSDQTSCRIQSTTLSHQPMSHSADSLMKPARTTYLLCAAWLLLTGLLLFGWPSVALATQPAASELALMRIVGTQ
jgi:hypothetical protein